jgi:hypothetical protein
VAKLTLAHRPVLPRDSRSAGTVYFTPPSSMASAADLTASVEPAEMQSILTRLNGEDFDFFTDAKVIATDLTVA